MGTRFRFLTLLAVTALVLVALPAPATAQTLEICRDDRVPYDYVVIDHKWNPTRCESTGATEPNMLVIERYVDKPADSTMVICSSSYVPTDWIVESTRFDAVRCDLDSVPGRLEHNVKVIRRMRGGGAVGGGGISDIVDPDAGITGVYSDMRRHATTGDVIGTEIFILAADDYGRSRYYALVQFAEGVPEAPQLVDVDVSGDRIEFDAYLFGQRMNFRGRVTRDYLDGSFTGPAGEVRLPRGRSFWQ